ncbi:MAG: Bug family tripartite tricarboxylate transporter substrate binding protein [Burkholderiales bacterium]
MTEHMIRYCLIFFATSIASIESDAFAQTFPTKPVRIMVTVPAGGAADVVARLVSPKMGEALGQPVLVENSAGQFGTIAATRLAKTTADGHTLMFTTPSAVILAHYTVKDLAYTLNDHTPVTAAVETVSTLAVHPGLPVTNARELVEYVKRNPAKVNYGAGAAGSIFHLMMEGFMAVTETSLFHVPYKGVIDAVNATVTGETQATMSSLSNVRAHIPTGKLRILAVLEGKRFASLSEIPTLSEAYPGFEKPQSWFGLFGPPNMPPAVTRRLYVEMSAALKSPDIRPKLDAAGMDVIANSPEEFAALIKRGFVTYGVVAKRAGLKPQ